MLSEALLAAIYNIALDEAAFSRVSQPLAEHLGYRYGLLSLRRNEAPLELSLNQPEIVMTAYYEHYFKLDPWTSLASKARPGELIAGSEDPGFYDSEFYVDFARPMGVVDPIGVRLPIDRNSELIVGLNQSLNSWRPTAEDGQQVQAVAQHLQRAVQLRERLRGQIAERETLMSALDRVDFGLVITSADGRVHALNRAAELGIAAGCGRGCAMDFWLPSMGKRRGRWR